MQRHNKAKWQLMPIFWFWLLVMARKEVTAICIRVNNEELIEYNCEGGSLEDLKEVPDKVEKIRMSNIFVGQIDETLLSRFGNSLLVFTCSHCLIEEISDKAFEPLRNLQQLSLDNNQLSKVSASWFGPGLTFLTYLDLNYNKIETLDSDIFGLLPNLVDLRLSGNRIECLDFQALSLLHDLKRIFLNENSNFGCPNALVMYLKARGIDYESDQQWNRQSRDRLVISKVGAQVDPESKIFTTQMQSSSETTLPTPPREFYTSDLLQSFPANQGHTPNQSEYYDSAAIPQQRSNYWKITQNHSNHSRETPLSSISTSLATEPTATKCSISAASSETINHIVLITIIAVLIFVICM